MILQISTLPPEFPFHPLLILKPLIAAFSRHALPPTCVSIFYNPFFFSAQSNFLCPEKDGYFPDPRQCDKYYDCYDGVAEEVLCPDGMVFNPNFDPRREPCDHYFQVECGDRIELRKWCQFFSIIIISPPERYRTHQIR